eukprot:CAMPEP_0181171640 /NCGR_PEP_ID=MMETSP1096-20121128/2021_1 /TAXON_ID=156174 ORGANISM="Chrysochromulina ericina, Strain CCMP281" /NCGR_SAMPLE_ID=MMETSP1096 /ASSEMBLY_ACC=CAM_ASM_000453 /LENGTH=85 /DNA_ID=CAMNT_0023259309 /DNA_START=222 /DNA_END=476 /DNA_ORIENTATION=+
MRSVVAEGCVMHLVLRRPRAKLLAEVPRNEAIVRVCAMSCVGLERPIVKKRDLPPNSQTIPSKAISYTMAKIYALRQREKRRGNE